VRWGDRVGLEGGSGALWRGGGRLGVGVGGGGQMGGGVGVKNIVDWGCGSEKGGGVGGVGCVVVGGG